MANNNQNTIFWTAQEFKHYPKNLGWYVTSAAVGVLVVLYFVFIENDIFAAVSLGIIFLFLLFFAAQKPREVRIEINTKGIEFGNIFYPFKQIKFFWIVNNVRHKTLNFQTTALLNNVIIIELENQNVDQIHNYLLHFLPEHKQVHETFTQKIMHVFKF